MDEDPLGWGLRPVELADQGIVRSYFASLSEPLSDYTFSQIYTWRNSLRILWTILDGHLCVFANGTGDLTLLMPPIGDTGTDRALARAFELMNDYNVAHGVPERSRVEYASDELLGRIDPTRLAVSPMGADYLYDVNRMIDLAGSDLASKRQAKNRFLRLYRHRVEEYDPAKHLDDCLALLDSWRIHQDAQHLEESNTNAIKRQKETIATELTLRCAGELGLKGMVVYVEEEGSGFRVQGSDSMESARSSSSSLNPEPRTLNPLRAFTFGESIGTSQCSIVIEKTDLDVKGLAQFTFSEFCARYWSRYPLVNVGDDWGLETLAWTKQSYRPVKLLQKYMLRKHAPAAILVPRSMDPAFASAEGSIISQQNVEAEPVVRAATEADVNAAVELEQVCFSAHCLTKRQLQYLRRSKSAVFLVAEHGDAIIGEGVSLVRRHKKALSGRIYSLAVHPDRRGRNIGRRLLRSMLHELSTRGVQRVYLEVEQNNQSAIRLYAQHGFRPLGTLRDYYGAGHDGVHMMCDMRRTLFDAVEAA